MVRLHCMPHMLGNRKMLVVTQSKAGRRLSRRLVATAKTTLFVGISFTLVAGLCWSLPARADDTQASLARLENKFFLREYGKDSIDARIERLEKMVFGESKTGSTVERMKALLALVPNDAATQNPAASSSAAAESTVSESTGRDKTPANRSSRRNAGSGSELPAASANGFADVPDVGADLAAGSGRPGSGRGRGDRRGSEAATAQEPRGANSTESYPAVTLIEKRTLGQGHTGEPIGQRLDRLEAKVFGKPSGSTDLSWRVDRLKDATNADISKLVPANSDWADEDEGPSASYESGDTRPYTQEDGADGRTFSGRNLRSDMQKAFGRPNYPTPSSGSYGMSGGGTGDSYSGGGAYGMGGGSRSRTSAGAYADRGGPAPAPDFARQSSAPRAAMGLSQQLSMLENELFRKTFDKETIPNRLTRLEQTVYPGEASHGELSLPDRVRRLSDAVQVSPQNAGGSREIASSPRRAPAYEDAGEDPDNMAQSAPRPAPQRAGSGLSKLINGLGNLMGGGSFANSYPMATSGQLVRDPVSGMLYDPFTGNLYDPVTGVVMGQRTTQGGGYGSGFGYGMSPIGGTPYSPYGMGGMGTGGMRFGFGGSGIRFGSGVGGAPIWP